MITIQSIMLVSLGFLGALLLGLVIVPAYRRRVERLTTNAIKQAMPLTEAEIRADKDRLRADYAIVIHEINAKLEKRSLEVARQRVEINRRDAVISGLEGDVVRMRTSLEEHENARRVLEHTIMDRMPKVELRLSEARKLLTHRDREIAKLSTSSKKQTSALEQATQINAQNRDEIHRLNAAMATRAARSREAGMGDPRFDGEVALRSEIEVLRAKTRDQASMITRLQGMLERAGGTLAGAAGVGAGLGNGDGRSSGAGTHGTQREGGSSGPLSVLRAEDEIARLTQNLNDAESALRSVQSSADQDDASRDLLENELNVLRGDNEDQVAEIAQLKAKLSAYEEDYASERVIPDSKAAMKARISQLTALGEEHGSTISRLRAEVAAGNEKLARQAAHFMDEMRRLGAGSMPMAAPPPGAHGDPRSRMTNGTMNQSYATRGRSSDKRALSDRIADPRARELVGAAAAATASNAANSPPPILAQVEIESKPLRSMRQDGGAPGVSSDMSAYSSASGDGGNNVAANDEPPLAASDKKPAKRAGGLIDRITRLDGSK